MRPSISLILVLMVLAMTSHILVVNCRVLASQKKATHEPLKDVIPTTSVIKEKANTEDNVNARVLIDSQFHTMSSGPSRRGSGH
ncbi:hypothetical protein Fmac_002353 [Flemingia macrophylla]|uniref:Uncharacterized protein n=1 Tax=Flemingia macrophylla TaxID=520843 RepID=A0ABD1NKG7_9FABA